MPQDDHRPGTPEHWLARAVGHLSLCQQPKPAGSFWEDLAFHAQQAAELALKAVHQHHGLTIRWTHNLGELGEALEKAGIDLPAEAREAAILTRYAVQTRYPGVGQPVTEDEFGEALRLARAIVNWASEVVGG